MNDQLKHYGVLGMRWGVRRASKAIKGAVNSVTNRLLGPKVSERLQKGRDGKTYLVKKVKNSQSLFSKSDTISRKQLTQKEVASFLKKKEIERVDNIIKREKVARVGRAVATLITAYQAYKVYDVLFKMSASNSDTYNAAYTAWLRNG